MKINVPKLTFFFCIGCQKSGTTLLARVLDQHPKIACIWESYALQYNSYNSIINPASDSWKKHGFQEENVQAWARVWANNPKNFAFRVLRKLTGYDYFRIINFRQTMSEALLDFARRCNATVVGDKWPWYINHIDVVTEAFPDAKFIYNVRDPRGIWNSAQRFKERQRGDEILREMLDKDRQISPYLHRDNFITIRYEDLLYNQAETCKRLYHFLGCEFSNDYLFYKRQADPYQQRWDWIPEASMFSVVNPCRKSCRSSLL
ncbi:MAG: sulfotransferase [Symploca sp. SIO2E9]|nr:sulfotransferase [Symploca sp. SIO2E9]